MLMRKKTSTYMMTSDKNRAVFPITNSSACVFKWGWNTFRAFNGMSSSCHRVTPVQVQVEKFDSFHNTPEVLQDRQLMLQGQWPQGRGCEYCKTIEDAGGLSDRLYHNQIPDFTPTDFNYSVYASPSISEIYLHNTCDLACVYCLPLFSSRVNQELKTFGPYPIGMQPVVEHPQRTQYLEQYYQWLKTNISSLNRISVLGGEPLLQKEFSELIKIISTSQNPKLRLSINTNLNAEHKKLENFIEIVKNLVVKRHIGSFHVSASLDCWGPQADFVRYGINLDRWLKNFETLSNHRWIELSVHQVITSLTIKTAHQLQDKIATFKKSNPKILQDYHLVDSGYEKIYHPEIFGKDFFIDQLEDLLKNFPVSTEWDKMSRQRLEGIVKSANNFTIDSERLLMLKQTLNAIDQRRNTQWAMLWPEIDQFFYQNGI